MQVLQEEYRLETSPKVCHVYHHKVHLARVADFFADISQRPEYK